jgi:hypothetical protein
MREDDGRKLDHHTLEVLRLRAVDQVARVTVQVVARVS